MDTDLFALSLGSYSPEIAVTSIKNYLASKADEYNEIISQMLTNNTFDGNNHPFNLGPFMMSSQDYYNTINSKVYIAVRDVIADGQYSDSFWIEDPNGKTAGIDNWLYFIKFILSACSLSSDLSDESLTEIFTMYTDATPQDIDHALVGARHGDVMESLPILVPIYQQLMAARLGALITDWDGDEYIRYIVEERPELMVKVVNDTVVDYVSSNYVSDLIASTSQMTTAINSFIDTALEAKDSAVGSATNFITKVTSLVANKSKILTNLVNAGSNILACDTLNPYQKVISFINLTDSDVIDEDVDDTFIFTQPDDEYNGLCLKTVISQANTWILEVESALTPTNVALWIAGHGDEIKAACNKVGEAFAWMHTKVVQLKAWADRVRAWSNEWVMRVISNPIDVSIMNVVSDDLSFDEGYYQCTVANGKTSYTAIAEKLEESGYNYIVIPWYGATIYIHATDDENDNNLYVYFKKHVYRFDAINTFLGILGTQGVTLNEIKSGLAALCADGGFVEAPSDTTEENYFYKSMIYTEIFLDLAMMVYVSGTENTWLQIAQDYGTQGSWDAVVAANKWFNSRSIADGLPTTVTNTQFIDEIMYGNYTPINNFLTVVNGNMNLSGYNFPYFISNKQLSPRYHVLTDKDNKDKIIHSCILVLSIAAAAVLAYFGIKGLLKLRQAAYAANVKAGLLEFNENIIPSSDNPQAALLSKSAIKTARKARIKANFLSKISGTAEAAINDVAFSQTDLFGSLTGIRSLITGE